MKTDHRDALRFALEKGIANGNKDADWLFCNASPIPDLPNEWKQRFVCEQDLRPLFLNLLSEGYRLNESREHRTGGVLYLLNRSRLFNQHMLASLWNEMKIGGRLIVAGNKADGAGSLRKWFSAQVPGIESLSKFHAIVFWADKTTHETMSVANIERKIAGYQLAEGMFSSDGPDRGSKLLVEHFDLPIRGKVADLGAGWGYLSCELLKRTNQVTEIELYEADRNAVVAAEENLRGIGGASRKFHWCDVTSEFQKKPFDWVIMNPPFHSSREADPELGQRFIEVAASTLPNGGRLLMVANRNLPYERTLDQKFRKLEKLTERDGFKVIEAVK